MCYVTSITFRRNSASKHSTPLQPPSPPPSLSPHPLAWPSPAPPSPPQSSNLSLQSLRFSPQGRSAFKGRRRGGRGAKRCCATGARLRRLIVMLKATCMLKTKTVRTKPPRHCHGAAGQQCKLFQFLLSSAPQITPTQHTRHACT